MALWHSTVALITTAAICTALVDLSVRSPPHVYRSKWPRATPFIAAWRLMQNSPACQLQLPCSAVPCNRSSLAACEACQGSMSQATGQEGLGPAAC